ncbi:hypothetical protein JVU11DRAFT_3189 [Chiua virens]|nr:hypothetical protein JVU11DRAFT_3189 [Chiua virens]
MQHCCAHGKAQNGTYIKVNIKTQLSHAEGKAESPLHSEDFFLPRLWQAIHKQNKCSPAYESTFKYSCSLLPLEDSHPPQVPQALPPDIPSGFHFCTSNEQIQEGFDDTLSDIKPDFPIPDLDRATGSESHDLPNVELCPGTASVFPGEKIFIQAFFADKYGPFHCNNLFYPFASQENWQVGSWLLHSGLSMAEIDNFLKLDLINTSDLIWVCKAAPFVCKDATLQSTLEVTSSLHVSPNAMSCDALLL